LCTSELTPSDGTERIDHDIFKLYILEVGFIEEGLALKEEGLALKNFV
jgi:hypothetical protein